MRIRTVIRKSVKWGGALAVVLLVAVCVASAKWHWSWKVASNCGVSIDASCLGVFCYDTGIFPQDSLSVIPIFYDGGDSSPTWRGTFQRASYASGGVGVTRTIIPLWPFSLLTLIVTGFAWRADLIARRRAMVGSCLKCGYSRVGLAPDAVCPECGAAAVVAGSARGAP